MDRSRKLEDTIFNLRSVTQSVKGGVPFDRLKSDYRILIGHVIPYEELGFSSLEQFIRSIPDVITIEKNSFGQLVAVGKADESTAHIVSLVSRQKTENKKPIKTKQPYRSYGARPYRNGTRDNSRPSRISSTYNNASRSSTARFQSRTPLPPPPQKASASYHSNASASSSRPRPPPPSRGYEMPPRFLNRPNKEEIHQPAEPKPPTRPSTFSSFTNYAAPPVIDAPSPIYDDPSPVYDVPSPSARILSPLKVSEAPNFKPTSHSEQIAAPNPNSEPKKYVEYYAKKCGVSFEYRTKRIGQKKKSFISSLVLGDKSYSTYDIEQEMATKDQAELQAAKLAVDDIMKEEHKDLFPKALIGNAESQQIFVDRILEIVCEKPTGIFSNGVLREYEFRFKETLPEGWLDVVKKNSDLDIEVPYGTRLPKDIYILRRARDSSSGCTTPSSTSSKTEIFRTELDATTLSNSIANIHVLEVPQIPLPMGNQWDVFITYVESTTSMACRLVNYADEFAEMSEEMRRYYPSKGHPVHSPIENHLYAASFDNDADQLWHRVLIDSIGEEGQVFCYFVDEGDIVQMNVSNLQELEPQFHSLAYQALHIKLSDLEDYEKVIKLEYLQEHLLGQTLVAEVLRRDDDVYSVVLYNTSGSADVNLNEVLRQLTISDSLKWELPEIGTTSIAYLTHVEENGEIFLRFNCPHLSILEAEMGKLSPKFEEITELNISSIPPGVLCAAKYFDDTWYRARVLEYSDSTNTVANVMFTDYGNTALVPISRLCKLESIDKFLACAVPNQAVKCRLHKVAPPDSEWTSAAIEKLIELAPSEDELIIRVETQSDGINCPTVNVFKRNKDSYIISINETLASQPELFRKSTVISPPAASSMSLPLQTFEMPSHCKMASPTEVQSLSQSIPDVALSAAAADEQIARRRVEFGATGDDTKSILVTLTRTGTKHGTFGSEVQSPNSNVINWVDTPDISSPLDINEHQSQALSFPDIPPVGKDFDVLVTVAASPSNFVVQPYKSGYELDKLMENMNTFYSDEENHCPMHYSLLKENYFYAALHEDKLWYRVRINKVLPGDTVMAVVHFVDFGDFATVTMSNLQCLFQEFKSLPCQAIRASLAGVQPNGVDWNPLQCVTFQDLVKQKPFVSIVKAKRISNDCNFPTEVELLLIDTTAERDISINTLLVERKIARWKP